MAASEDSEHPHVAHADAHAGALQSAAATAARKVEFIFVQLLAGTPDFITKRVFARNAQLLLALASQIQQPELKRQPQLPFHA